MPPPTFVTGTLAKEGRVCLYGIDFDTSIDTPRADAKPTLAAARQPENQPRLEDHYRGSYRLGRDAGQKPGPVPAPIKAYLVKGGIDAARLTPAGFGQTKPVASNDTNIGRAQNRRVEIAKD